MHKLNVHEAKTHLSRVLAQMEEDGEVIVICRRNVPVAEIRPLSSREGTSKRSRPIGLDEGKFEISPEVFAPLPEDVVASIYGILQLGQSTDELLNDLRGQPDP